MKLKNKLITTAAFVAALAVIFCFAFTVGAAEAADAVALTAVVDGDATVNVSLSLPSGKTVDYVQVVLTPTSDAAKAASVTGVTTKVENLGVEYTVENGVITLLAVPSAEGVAMADGTTVFTCQMSSIAVGDALTYTADYVLCYTDGTDTDGTVELTAEVTGVYTTRLEAETDSIYWRYVKATEAGVSGTVVGDIRPGTAANMQSFEDLANGTVSLKKTEHPMISFIVDVESEGDYTLNVTYRGAMKADKGAITDYFIVVGVDDAAYSKTTYVSAHPDDNRYCIGKTTVHLTAGRHTIRLITMLKDTASDSLYVNWLNVDYVDVTGIGKVSAVAPQWTHLQAGQASYYNLFTSPNSTGIADRTAKVSYDAGEWWNVAMGGYQGDGAGITKDTFTMDKLNKVGWYAYTVYVPADGFYDLQTYTLCAFGAKNADGNYTFTSFSNKRNGHIMLLVDEEVQWFPAEFGYCELKWNAQNLSCYLTEGYHTIAVSGMTGDLGTCSKDWCDMGALSVSGGITVTDVAQISPLASFTLTNKTLVLNNNVQPKVGFTITGYDFDAAKSGIKVWYGADSTEAVDIPALTANGGLYTAEVAGVAAKNQGDTLTIQGYILDNNGNYHYTEKVTYNAVSYAESIFAQADLSENGAVKPVAAALTQYHAAAEAYFANKVHESGSTTLWEDVTAALKAAVAYDASQLVALEIAPEVSLSGTETELTINHALELENKVQLKYIIAKNSLPSNVQLRVWKAGSDISTAKVFKLSDNSLKLNGNYYTATLEGDAAQDLGDTYFAVVTWNDANGNACYSQVDAYSVHAYAQAVINSGSTSETLKTLCKALVSYSYQAKHYFATKNASTIYASSNGSVYASGLDANTPTTWEMALVKVKEGGTIVLNNTLTTDSWPESTKAVTLAGTLDASALDTVNINGPVTFGALKVTFKEGATILANGHKFTISADAEVSGTPSIFGGSANATLESTNVTVLGGTYKNIYGGGQYGGITATNVTIGGNTVANQVFAGGGASGGWCDYETATVTVNGGTIMGVYGGNKYGPGKAGAKSVVNINGGTIEQVIGGHEWSNTKYEVDWGRDVDGDGTIEDVGTNVNFIGDIEINLNGGTITRRVIGGSYNEWSITWKSSRHVLGNITVNIGAGVDIQCSTAFDDYGIIAGSRCDHTEEVLGHENTKIVFADETTKTKYEGKLGLSYGVYLVSATNAADEITVATAQ